MNCERCELLCLVSPRASCYENKTAQFMQATFSRRRFLKGTAALSAAGLAIPAIATRSLFGAESSTLSALIVDGQNNHDYRATTPHLKNLLEQTGLFTVEVASTPGKGGDMSQFRPEFSKYRVIVSNYNGEPWSKETEDALVAFVRGGGGFVSVHAADNAFPKWREYNEMIGIGGWEGRNEKSGPYLRLREGKWVKDMTPGVGGSHGKQHEFVIETRAPEHPIMKGLPARWLHAKDELYDRLRGPAENVVVLASTF